MSANDKKKVLSEMIPLLLSDCAKMLANEKEKEWLSIILPNF